MKSYLILVFIFMACGCSLFKKKSILEQLKSEGFSIVSGCDILNLDGDLIRSFPGDQCLFFEDGSFLTYDPLRQELSKFSSKLEKQWSLYRHVHHYLTRTEDNNILVKTSSFHDFNGKKNVRFDGLILLSQEGKILGEFSFYETIKKLNQFWKRGPGRTTWEKNIPFKYEATHLASAYEVNFPIQKDGEIFVPKGSFIVSLNTFFSGLYILSSDLSKLIGFVRVLTRDTFHDAQQLSDSEVIYFINNVYTRPQSQEQEARVVIQDLYEKRYTKQYAAGFYASFGGSIQYINNDLLFISDLKSRFGEFDPKVKNSSEQIDRTLEHETKKARVVFFSPQKGILHEIHFDRSFPHAKLLKLNEFLAKVIPF